MKTSSAKAKGRRLQQHVANAIIMHLNLPESDVRSLPMGAQGCDVWLSDRAKKLIPLSIECKNTESLNIWKAIKQAEDNITDGTAPAVVFGRNRQDPYIALPLELFMYILARSVGADEIKAKT